MSPLKSSGPDGYEVCFHQTYRNIVGGEVCQATLSILNSGEVRHGN